MNTTTLTQLITRIRERADMVGSSFVTDREVTHMVNQSVADLHNLLVTLYENYYVKTAPDIALPGGNPTTVPADFYKALGVDFTTGGMTYSLKPFMFSERRAYANPFYANTALSSLYYQIQGDQLRFIPDDTTSGVATLWYIPEPSVFLDFSEGTASQSSTTVTGVGTNWTSDFAGATITWGTGETATVASVGGTTTLTVTPPQTVAPGPFTVSNVGTALNSVDREIARGYEEYIILDGTIKCLMKEESDVKMHVALREKVEEGIRGNAATRNPGDSYRITDVSTGTLQSNYVNWMK
jgi:hypothetical protein